MRSWTGGSEAQSGAEQVDGVIVYTKWSDIRREHIERIGRAEFEAGKKRMLAEVCVNPVLRDDNAAGVTESNHLPGDGAWSDCD